MSRKKPPLPPVRYSTGALSTQLPVSDNGASDAKQINQLQPDTVGPDQPHCKGTRDGVVRAGRGSLAEMTDSRYLPRPIHA